MVGVDLQQQIEARTKAYLEAAVLAVQDNRLKQEDCVDLTRIVGQAKAAALKKGDFSTLQEYVGPFDLPQEALCRETKALSSGMPPIQAKIYARRGDICEEALMTDKTGKVRANNAVRNV